MADTYRITTASESFMQDYPDIAIPILVANGSYRRRQTYRGKSTEIQKNSTSCVFAKLVDEDGNPVPTAGSILTSCGITSGIRGKKVGTLRPDLVVLDDLQSQEDASNPETVEKLLGIIRKDILNLSGKGKLACLMTATPIEPEDLVERIANDINWKTTRFPAIIRFPRDIIEKKDDGLWGEYFRIYDSENADDEPHKRSLKFYRDHRSEMDNGAELLNPKRYKKEDGFISGL